MRGRRHAPTAPRALPEPVITPAGPDYELRGVLEDLTAGRWRSAADLLATTGPDPDLMTARTQIMATVAARSDVVEQWAREAPGSTSSLMLARVWTQRTLHAARTGTDFRDAEARAREHCTTAAWTTPASPVPWVCLVALAEVDPHQTRPEHRVGSRAWDDSELERYLDSCGQGAFRQAPDPMLPPGPWVLWQQVEARHAGNRELYHRLAAVLRAARAAVPTGRHPEPVFEAGEARDRAGLPLHDFARWTATYVAPASAARLLPIYEQVRDVYAVGDTNLSLRRQVWRGLRGNVLANALAWFDLTCGGYQHPRDLNHLAYALSFSGMHGGACRVFEEISEHMTSAPWTYGAVGLHSAWGRLGFKQARTVAYNLAGPPASAPPRITAHR